MDYLPVVQNMVETILVNCKKSIEMESKSDKTVTCKIIVKINDRKYKVLYCGNEHTVSSSILCNVGDFVRICAPCNNWDDLFVVENKSKR